MKSDISLIIYNETDLDQAQADELAGLIAEWVDNHWLVIVTNNKCGYRTKYGICADTGKDCTKDNCPVYPGWKERKE